MNFVAVGNKTIVLIGSVLIVDDHLDTRESMAEVLMHAGYQVESCGGAAEALQVLQKKSFDVVITDLQMPGMDGLQFIQKLQEKKVDAQILMVTGYATVSSAVEAMRHGVFDYLEKPLRAEQLEQLVARAMRHASVLDCKTTLPPTKSNRLPETMIGDGREMQEMHERISQVAKTNETVLISGESGTGKELVAKAIHTLSRRSQQAMVSLNCPVLSAQLMESELFGHQRGAFTSADAPRVGRFELADKGTILLDEVTEIDLSLQAKLLRVLQEKTFERVGSSETLHVDVRVLATTNRDLQTEVSAGRFREDLYFRLAVLPICVPPLRRRREDIPALIEHFSDLVSKRLGKEPCQFHAAVHDLMSNYSWPGNIRELENIVTRANVLSCDKAISADNVRPWLIDSGLQKMSTQQAEPTLPIGLSLQEMEQRLIESTLEQFGGHREKTATALGIGVRTLSTKLRGYGLAPREKTFSKAA